MGGLFGGGGGSSGGGGGTTTQSSGLAEEDKPLHTAAVKQIIGLQDVNPLAQFGTPHVGTVPGLAPFTQAGFELAALTPYSTPSEQALGNLANPAAWLTNQLLSSFGRPDPTNTAILDRLMPGTGQSLQAPWAWSNYMTPSLLNPVFSGASMPPAPTSGAGVSAFSAPAGTNVPTFSTAQLMGPTQPALPPPTPEPAAAAPTSALSAAAADMQAKVNAQVTAQEMIYVNRDFWGAVKAYTDAGYPYNTAVSLVSPMWSAAASGNGLPENLPAGYTAVNPGVIPGYGQFG